MDKTKLNKKLIEEKLIHYFVSTYNYIKSFTSFVKELENKFSQPLPGLVSQMKMAPITRKLEMDKNKFRGLARESAVLILFYPFQQEIYTAFIKRQKSAGVHSGQIALPGGEFEKTDGTITGTALREANEEIGIITDQVTLIGSLTKLYIPPSNFNVLPVVGYTKKRPIFKIDPIEVDKVIEISLNQLADPKNNQYKEILHSNKTRVNVPAYFINDEIIWGATAMIIKELLDTIQS